MNFFKAFLASCLGIFTSVVLVFFTFFIIIIVSSSEPQPTVNQNSALVIELTGDIPARYLPNPIESYFDPSSVNRISLVSLKENLAKAASDDRISGVWVKANLVMTSWANLKQARHYLNEFKDSGKFLYFSTDDIGMNEQAYYLATTADSVFSPPSSNFEFDGFIAQVTFYRNMLDKLGIEPEIFRVGKYKSAVEPYLETESSPESKQQLNEILDLAMQEFIEAVSQKTGKSNDEINRLLNTQPIDRISFALENGLIDGIAFEDDVEETIKDRIGISESGKLNTIKFSSYTKIPASSAGLRQPSALNQVSVIFADGAILPQLGGESPLDNSGIITAKNFKKEMQRAVDNRFVKAIVVHVNSPGGAATTSDLIWNTIREAAKEKPVIASMGSVAASGGYYIAMAADTIVANPNSITGSIGVFNLLFNVEELTTEKLGINFDLVKTHQYADLYDLTRPFTAAEKRVIQANVESNYEFFLNRVAESRGMTSEDVHEIAQGRVWTGQAAQKIGLVDVLGSLDDAIEIAANAAGIVEYQIDYLPKEKALFEVLFSTTEARVRSAVMGWFPFYEQTNVSHLNSLMQQPASQTWMLLPNEITIK